jgi:hypothetical protein
MDINEPVTRDYLKITEYKLLGELPDPFMMDNGSRMTDPSQWEERRKEIYKTAIELQYGTQPPKPEFVEVELLHYSGNIQTFFIHTGTRERPVTFRMQLLLPQGVTGKIPLIVDGDQCWMYYMDKAFLGAALDRGIGWVLFNRTELAHDVNNEGRGQGQLYPTYPDYTFGALGAWAWGYSRCIDALEILNRSNIDMDWIAFTGHSRGGKTAALAGALETRAKIVNPNDTCAGACGCYRIHMQGYSEDTDPFRSETLADIARNFPFWFSPEYGEYANREEELPYDTHFLKAMVAPRILLVSEGAGDIWSNPVGSYQTSIAAKEVFDYLGAGENLYWYFRPGAHGHKVVDVEMLVNIIKHCRDGEPLDTRFFRPPFEPMEKAYSWKQPGK